MFCPQPKRVLAMIQAHTHTFPVSLARSTAKPMFSVQPHPSKTERAEFLTALQQAGIQEASNRSSALLGPRWAGMAL